MKIDKTYQYSKQRFDSAHGTSKTFLSNFEQLLIPIKCDQGFEYWNSEGLYMALRTQDTEARKFIAEVSKEGGAVSKKCKKLFELEQDETKRAAFMLECVRKKFLTNKELGRKLIAIEGEIIEKNWWKDDLFGVSDTTLKGANILGKCLMQVRDEIR